MAEVDYFIQNVEKLVKFDGKVKNVEITRLTAPGENYISVVLRVDFEVEKDGQSKIISSIAKRLPMSNNKKEDYGFNGFAMRNEIKWYSEIVPRLKKFAKDNQIKMDFYPEYFGSRYSLDSFKKQADNESVLILENLIPQGYHNDDRHIGSDFITSKAILKNLALFHALPIAIKMKEPKLFDAITDFFEKTRPGANGTNDGPDEPPGPPPGAIPLEEMLLETLDNISDFAPYLSKVRKLLLKERGPDSFNTLTKEPWNTVTHNDFWVNNIMVKNNEEEPLVKIVDFQMGSYGSYAKDLVFFLLTSVRNDVTREHMDDLLRIYYDEFTSVLHQANVNLELTYDDYLNEVNVAAQSEVGHAIFFSTIIFLEKGAGVDVDAEEFNPHTHFKEMLNKSNQYHKEKLVLIASEAIKRNWI